MRRLALALTIVAGVALPAGCERFAQLDASVTDAARAAPYPDLVPLEDLRTRMEPAAADADALAATQSRAAALKSRAGSLGGTVIDTAARARMQAGVGG